MLGIFSYNSYQTHYTIWVFALIVMGLGVIILAIRGKLLGKSFKE
ncbi:unnamed protein product [marine sediment metagenome]|uniref:Uncharacterized protein n=1 Tax=marine sediment metagenome TaxID=412755 RepID=X1T7I6_9ZZZZ